MVSYYISTPRRQGNEWVVDISEYYSGKTTRKATVKLEDIIKFLQGAFHNDLHEHYKEIMKSGYYCLGRRG